MEGLTYPSNMDDKIHEAEGMEQEGQTDKNLIGRTSICVNKI